MDVLYDVFRFPIPDWTGDFSQALLSVGEYFLISVPSQNNKIKME